MKEPLLYLCHRIPYPPNKGDKITTHNILKFLSNHFDLYLGYFVDDENDAKYITQIQKYTKDSFAVNLDPTLATIRGGVVSLINDEPISVSYYRDDKLQDWVLQTVKKYKIKKAFIYSGCMAQYVSQGCFEKAW